jgi:hypothetical protein
MSTAIIALANVKRIKEKELKLKNKQNRLDKLRMSAENIGICLPEHQVEHKAFKECLQKIVDTSNDGGSYTLCKVMPIYRVELERRGLSISSHNSEATIITW